MKTPSEITPNSFAPVPGQSKGISLGDLARRVGADQMEILRRFPDSFAVPRDWVMSGAAVIVRPSSLRAIAREFDESGSVGVGNKIRDVADELEPQVRREVAA